MATALAVHRHNETLLQSLEPGDLIEFPRGVYSHWAVYVGNEQVVHLAGDDNDGIDGQYDAGHIFSIGGRSFDKAWVKKENFWNVVEDTRAVKNNTKDEKYDSLPRSQIVRNALARIGRVGYNVLYSNCEHFASSCRYGLSKSDQADNLLTGLAVGATLAITGGIIYGLSRLAGKHSEEKEKN